MRRLVLCLLAFIATALNRNYQTDFWHHLARGRAIAESGGMVDHDLFTYTVAGQPFQDSNWLPQLFYFYLFEHGGLALVQTVNSLILALVMGGAIVGLAIPLVFFENLLGAASGMVLAPAPHRLASTKAPMMARPE